jgi:chromosome segregation ATPase
VVDACRQRATAFFGSQRLKFQQAEQRLREELHRTDQLLAEKQREIDELKQLLASQSARLGELAIGAAAVAELIDKDAVIQEQRKHLQRLQAEWEEKLRQAEIELSLERAKLARERVQLEEKLHALEIQAAQPPETSSAADDPQVPKRGRWLARLGLKNPENP